jgi:3-deoxy-7-phosphoheptulonate synthase
MQRPLDNQHIIDIKPLPSPRTIKSTLPITDQAAALVVETRDAVRQILHGQDRDRLLVIVGPCSIHDPEAAYEYADRLKPVADALRDRLLIVMRTYFEKPRTTVGWKGLINDPHLDGTCDIATGMELARTILLNINKRGLPCAAEALDPVSPQYIADLWSWVAIGARTTESQPHREMASGLSMPVGFKNGTEGNLQVAWNAMVAAKQPHHFWASTPMGSPLSSRPPATQTGISSCEAAAAKPIMRLKTWRAQRPLLRARVSFALS